VVMIDLGIWNTGVSSEYVFFSIIRSFQVYVSWEFCKKCSPVAYS
jgi:hypothetical protein